jgi:uncharacterized protein
MDEIFDDAAMHRCEMTAEDDIAVSYYQEQRFSGQGVGSRLVHAVLETLKARGRRVIAKCPFMASYAAKHPEYLAMLNG